MSRIHAANKRGTVAYGEGVFESDCEKAIVYNASRSTVAAIGLKDTAIVVTPDAVLAIARPLLPHIKKYLSMIKERGFPQTLF
jgi:mannose-1-phosphate guanylyltransferase